MIQRNSQSASTPRSQAGAVNAALPHLVECKSFAKFYEPIAAFNCIEAAQYYMTGCAEANPRFAYRINSHYEG